jgi:xylan 1,4-beta-xylosidase
MGCSFGAIQHSLDAREDGGRVRRGVRERYGPFADRLLAAYPTVGEGVTKTARDLARDAAFGWHTWSWARLQSARGTGKAFLYYFDQHPPRTPGTPEADHGAPHGVDVPFVFENLDAKATAEDRHISETMAAYWTNFAKRGDPNGEGLPAWPAFSDASPVVMHLGPTARTGPVPSAESLKVLDEYFAWRRTPAAPVASQAPGASADPRFDWFEYRGEDAVFRDSAAGPGEYQNPILTGFYPDPSIARAGDDYYLVHSTFAYFPGIPVHHSRDLVTWRQIGNVIDRPAQLDFDGLGISRGVFAPTIEYHQGTFYVLNTCVDCGGNFVVTATNPAGPWSDPVWLREVGGIDPSLYFDDDGRAWVLNNDAPIGPPLYEGHRAIWIQEFNPKTNQTFGPRTLLVNGGVDITTKPIWIEGPHITKLNGWYYLTAAEGGTAVGHSQVVLRSRNVLGPYEPWSRNPILTQRDMDPARPHPVTSAGHADMVQTQTGEWWATFLAVRPYEGDYYNTGRETFLLPVTWVDGWPVILPRGELIPYRHARPNLPRDEAPHIPTTGNFTVRDEFDGPELAPYWLMVRTPRERWHDFTSHPGSLTLRARPQHLGRLAQPSYVGRRQQHMTATATTAMRYAPAREGDRAGLAAFQNDDYYYLMSVALDAGRPTIQLHRAAAKGEGANPALLASAPLNGPVGAPLYLRITADRDRYDFHYGHVAGEWKALHTGADGKILSTRTSGGFVGVTFGLYAYTAAP